MPSKACRFRRRWTRVNENGSSWHADVGFARGILEPIPFGLGPTQEPELQGSSAAPAATADPPDVLETGGSTVSR
jgi:hypothetical protein